MKISQRSKTFILPCIIIVFLLGIFFTFFISNDVSNIIFSAATVTLALLSVILRKINFRRMVWILSCIVAYACMYTVWNNLILFQYDIGAWVALHCTFTSAYISVVFAFYNKFRLTGFSFAGYNFGVIAGGLWGQISFDPGGGLLHNGWIIWIVVFLASIIVGIIIEIIIKKKR